MNKLEFNNSLIEKADLIKVEISQNKLIIFINIWNCY